MRIAKALVLLCKFGMLVRCALRVRWPWVVQCLGLALCATFDLGEILPIQTWLGSPTAVPSFLREDFDVALTHPVNSAHYLVFCNMLVCGGKRAEAVFAQPGHRTGSLLKSLTSNANVNCTNCASRVVLHADQNARLLVLAGNDRHSSTFTRYGMKCSRLVDAFRKGVFVSALNHRVLGVRPWPVLFSQDHLMRAPAAVILSLAKTPMRELTALKDRWLFAAWGAMYPQLDRSPSCRDRASAREWVTRHAHEPWVHSAVLPASAYWGTLKRHRFMLSPSGLGVQSPKTYESILAGAVPICHARNAAYRRLRDEGWPIVIVDDWGDVNATSMRAWWAGEVTRLDGARRCMMRPTFSAWAVRGGQRIADCMRNESFGA